MPQQVIYDKYNDRIILNGYYKNVEEAFKSPKNNAMYYVAYDSANDKLYKNLGERYSDLSIKCFAGKDKAIIDGYDSSYHSIPYLYDVNYMTGPAEMDYDYYSPLCDMYCTVGNDVYAYI